MNNPWRRSDLTIAVRLLIVILLLGATAFPARDGARRNFQAVALLDPMAGSDIRAIRERLLREMDDPSHVTIKPSISNVHRALRDALWQFDSASQGLLILVSAGRWHPNTMETLQDAAAAKIPVFWLPLPDNESSPGIGKFLAPSIARAGQSIGVSVDIQLQRSTNAEIILLANGQPIARKAVNESGTFDFPISAPEVSEPGPLVLGAELRNMADGYVIDEVKQGALVNIAGAPTVLVVSQRPSAFGKSLRDGGWSVVESQPSNFAAQLDRLSSIACLVLDDVATTDLPSIAWARIQRAVRRDAMGLLVLGGLNSFGLGGYRDSPLERLLPVISEPPEYEAPASLVFLIDVSGSMERPGETNNRLQMAKQATIETAKALRPVDRVGLMTFDVQINELLEIDSRADHSASIERVWPRSASGGTVLMPSLLQAIDTLQRDASEQKLLVLLTDGFLADEDLRQLGETLQESDIQLLAMIVGDSASSEFNALAEVTDASGGKTIRIDDILRLPTLMRNEVESRRPALVSGQSQPMPMSPTAWLPHDVVWPDIETYLLTRPREEAQVHLISERGDVLIASIAAGAGKVIAVTSGFSGWSEAWLRWDRWPAFAADLTGYLAARDSRHVAISVGQNGPDNAELVIELQERTLPDHLSVTLVGPTGSIDSVDLRARGPGQLTAPLELAESGQFTVVVEADEVTTRHRFFKRSPSIHAVDEPPIARAWLDDGLLQLWDAKALRDLEQDRDWRTGLMTLALLGFLSSLVLERVDPKWASEWLSFVRTRSFTNTA